MQSINQRLGWSRLEQLLKNWGSSISSRVTTAPSPRLTGTCGFPLHFGGDRYMPSERVGLESDRSGFWSWWHGHALASPLLCDSFRQLMYGVCEVLHIKCRCLAHVKLFLLVKEELIISEWGTQASTNPALHSPLLLRELNAWGTKVDGNQSVLLALSTGTPLFWVPEKLWWSTWFQLEDEAETALSSPPEFQSQNHLPSGGLTGKGSQTRERKSFPGLERRKRGGKKEERKKEEEATERGGGKRRGKNIGRERWLGPGWCAGPSLDLLTTER